jgi:type I restriction enzyme, S subunit
MIHTAAPRFMPYPEYKNSEVDLLGEIPAHWAVATLKRIGSLQGGAGFPEDEQGNPSEEILFFKVGDIGTAGNEREMKSCPNTVSRSTARRLHAFVFPPRTIAFAKVGAALLLNRRRLLHSHSCLDNNMMGFIPAHCNPDWALYWLEGLDFRQIANPGAIPSVNEDQLSCIYAAVPPLKEQEKISLFLNRDTTKIDDLLAKKARLILLLHEKRHALIADAVTKGLDSKVAMKDSGVEWLGKIPKHWTCLSLSLITRSRCDGPFGSSLKSEHYSDSGVRVVRLQNIGMAEFRGSDRVYLDPEYARGLGDHSVQPGDLLVAGLGDDRHPAGRACVAPEELGEAIVKADCFRFRLDPGRVLPQFAAYQLSVSASSAAGSMAAGATRSRMNLSSTASLKLAIPPLSEQHAIVAEIATESRGLHDLCLRVAEAIEHLREYRTALISAAVTGKIDVRGKAA